MDGDDILAILAFGPMSLLLIFLLTILLRVACHYAGVEIPALGRAYFTTGAMTVLSVLTAYLLLRTLAGLEWSRVSTLAVFLTLALSLAANLLISIGLYRVLLNVRLSEALSLWLYQIVLFGLLALILSCCIGVPIRMLA